MPKLINTPLDPMRALEYRQYEKPTVTGIYACRIPTTPEIVADGKDILCCDKFLYWDNERKKWGYMGSSEWYRGKVVGWIGPLPRLNLPIDEPF